MGLGKWSQLGVPQIGWTCVDIEDLGEPSAKCEMCEHQEIRYVHYMTHSNYPDTLACGCDCAGRMENDYANAEKRDSEMRNSASRRQRFPNLKSWHLSAKGNWTLAKDGARSTIFQKPAGWKFVIHEPPSEVPKYSRKTYNSKREAQLAVFDALIWLRSR